MLSPDMGEESGKSISSLEGHRRTDASLAGSHSQSTNPTCQSVRNRSDLRRETAHYVQGLCRTVQLPMQVNAVAEPKRRINFHTRTSIRRHTPPERLLGIWPIANHAPVTASRPTSPGRRRDRNRAAPPSPPCRHRLMHTAVPTRTQQPHRADPVRRCWHRD